MAARKSTANKAEPRKRLARDSDRAYAAELARRYRTREPKAFEYDGKVIEEIITGDVLAMYLEIFAERGTWDYPVEIPAEDRRIILRENVLRLSSKHNISTEAAIAIVLETGEVSEQTVRDAVYPRKARKA